MKNFEIKTRVIKSLMEEEIPSETKWGVWVELGKVYHEAPPSLMDDSH